MCLMNLDNDKRRELRTRQAPWLQFWKIITRDGQSVYRGHPDGDPYVSSQRYYGGMNYARKPDGTRLHSTRPSGDVGIHCFFTQPRSGGLWYPKSTECCIPVYVRPRDICGVEPPLERRALTVRRLCIHPATAAELGLKPPRSHRVPDDLPAEPPAVIYRGD